MRYLPNVLAAFLLLVLVACVETTSSRDVNQKEEPEQDLKITFGGFIQNGPQDELLDGQCRPNATRDVLQCDMHNGLMTWNITEITFQVIRTGDGDEERHYYRERLSIAPLQTETATIKLGMQLPPDTQFITRGRPVGKPQSHWTWLIVGAKGQPSGNERGK